MARSIIQPYIQHFTDAINKHNQWRLVLSPTEKEIVDEMQQAIN